MKHDLRNNERAATMVARLAIQAIAICLLLSEAVSKEVEWSRVR
jgi:hypothetical protein